MNPLELPWWVYLACVFSFFGVCMGLNYLVKKINEAKIEERLIRMLHKASTTQSTQVTGPLIAVETSGAGRLNNLRTMPQLSPPGISLVFNREENKRRSDPYGLIKPIVPRISIENIDIIPPRERTVNSAPMKRIGSAQVVAKANSSHILTEKVFIKTSEYGNQSIKKTSTSKSDCFVAKVITVKMNEYGNVSDIGPYPAAEKRSNTSKMDSEIQGIPAEESTTSIHVQNENPINNEARTESGSKAEETTPKEKIDVTEKILYEKNIYTSRIIRTKTSIVDITVEKQGINDSKTNEEVNTGCSIKKSVESLISKIASNLKNKSEDPKIGKNVENSLFAAKQSSSNTGNGRKIIEKNSAEKKESRCNTAKEHSFPAETGNVGDNYPVEKIESEYIKRTASDSKSNRLEEHFESEHNVTKKSSSYSRIGHIDENITNKNVESHIAAKKSTSSHAFERVRENVSNIKVESGYTAIKQTIPAYSQEARVEEYIPAKKVGSGRSDSKETTSTHSLAYVSEDRPVKKLESKHTAIKQTISANSQVARADENIPTKKVESSHIVAEKSNSIHSCEGARENIPVETVKLDYISAKDISSAQSHNEYTESNTPVKKVETGHIVSKEIASVHSLELKEEHIPTEQEHDTAKDTASFRTLHRGENIPAESGIFDVKETATSLVSQSKDDNEGVNNQMKKVESDHITVKEAILSSQNPAAKKELVSVKKSVILIESRQGDSEKPTSNLRPNYIAKECADIKKIDSERVPYTQNNSFVTSQRRDEEDAKGLAKTNASLFRIHNDITVIKQGIKKKAEQIGTRETIKTRVDDYIDESSVVKMSKAALYADKTKYSKELDLENKKEDNELDNFIIETKDSYVISGTSKTKGDAEEEEEPSKSLTDKIIELLEDENIVDIKLRKPSPSSKK